MEWVGRGVRALLAEFPQRLQIAMTVVPAARAARLKATIHEFSLCQGNGWAREGVPSRVFVFSRRSP